MTITNNASQNNAGKNTQGPQFRPQFRPQCRRAIEVRPAARLLPLSVQERSETVGEGSAVHVQQQYSIRGYAAVFGVVTELFRWGDNVFEEVVERGAFAASLARGDDVACVVEHDWRLVVARRSGGTLDLAEDETGLKVSATLAKTTKSDDLVEDIRHGNIKGMSFRFYPTEDAEEVFDRVEGEGATAKKVRVHKRTIRACDISDVSPCVWPAYPTTTLSLEDGQRSAGSASSKESPAPVSGRVPNRISVQELPEWIRCKVEAIEAAKRSVRSREVRSRAARSLVAARVESSLSRGG